MTETEHVSIDEVRALVVERQRYDDWLSALEARRAETPERVFERVHGDYVARRRDVLTRLREHVGGLSSTRNDLEARLHAVDAQLGSLEDERAEAMLRTAVGEYDSDRWERVRHDVEAQIAELGETRTAVMAELEEVRSLLANAGSDPEPETATPIDDAPETPLDLAADFAPASSSEHVETGSMTSTGEPAAEVEADPSTTADWPVAASGSEGWATADQPDVLPAHTVSSPEFSTPSTTAVPADREALDDLLPGVSAASPESTPQATNVSSADGELAELDDALALFSSDRTPDGFSPGSGAPSGSSLTGLPTALDGVDVFDDAELGDLRMAPPSRTTATVTPPTSPVSGNAGVTSSSTDNARDGFDDLAFLRSVVDAGAPTGAVRGPASGEQQKTLRCTECGTMNLPTEWYCERCGGELAAF